MSNRVCANGRSIAGQQLSNSVVAIVHDPDATSVERCTVRSRAYIVGSDGRTIGSHFGHAVGAVICDPDVSSIKRYAFGVGTCWIVTDGRAVTGPQHRYTIGP